MILQEIEETAFQWFSNPFSRLFYGAVGDYATNLKSFVYKEIDKTETLTYAVSTV